MTIPAGSGPRVFVSYSSQDRPFAERLVADLQNAGANVWIDEVGIGHGNFLQRIDEALTWAEWMVLVLTPAAISSDYVRTEVYTALHRVNQHLLRDVVPVLAEYCPPDTIPPQWGILQRYDATSNYAAAMSGVLRALGVPSKGPLTAQIVVSPSGPSSELTNPPESLAPAASRVPASAKANDLTPRKQVRRSRWMPVIGAALALVVIASAALIAIPKLGPLFASKSPTNTLIRTPTPHISGRITEYLIPTSGSQSEHITVGPDGALWFTESVGNKIGRITSSGMLTEYVVPTSDSGPNRNVEGPDGALWFTERNVSKIGRIAPDTKKIGEFTVPTPNSIPSGLTVGPDGAIWFTEEGANKIGRITTGGNITEFAVPTIPDTPDAIISGPDGALWFTEYDGNKIGRITSDGKTIQGYAIPTPNSQPRSLTVGSDGAIWFAEGNDNKIGRITTDGQSISEITIPSVKSYPVDISVGPDHALWFSEENVNKIGRISMDNQVTEFAMQSSGADPFGITKGPADDFSVWFTEVDGNKIGVIR